MLTQVAGEDTEYMRGQELVVGRDIPEPLAVAYCRYPDGDPRAEPIGWDPAVPSERTATHPAAETRETATQRGRRGTKPIPDSVD